MHAIIDIAVGFGVGLTFLRIVRRKGAYGRVALPEEREAVPISMRQHARTEEVGTPGRTTTEARRPEARKNTRPPEAATPISTPYVLGDGGAGDRETAGMMAMMSGPGLCTPAAGNGRK